MCARAHTFAYKVNIFLECGEKTEADAVGEARNCLSEDSRGLKSNSPGSGSSGVPPPHGRDRGAGGWAEWV